MRSTTRCFTRCSSVVFLVFILLAGFLGISPHQPGIPSVDAFHYPWDQGHDTTDWIDPEDPGPCEGSECECDLCNGASTGSPVYLATGHFIWEETDILLKGRPYLSFSRTFNSNDPRTSKLGLGWSTTYDVGLFYVSKSGENNINSINKTNEYVRILPSGKRYIYKQESDNLYKAPGLFDSIVRQNDGSSRLFQRDGSYSDYNTTGNIVLNVDRNGNVLNFEYDEQNRLISISDSNERSLNYSYNTAGFVAAIRDHSNRSWNYEYDNDGNLISVTNPLGGIRLYEYTLYQPPGDNFVYSHLTRIIDESGVVVTEVTYNNSKVSNYKDEENTLTYQYDEANRETTQIDSVGSEWVYTYNDDGLFTKIEAPLGRITTYERDDNGLLTKLIDPSRTEYNYTYNSFGSMLTSSDTRGAIKLEYQQDRPWANKITSVSGRTTNINYDAHGNIISLTDPGNAITTFDWSSQGDLLSIINDIGQETRISYSPQGMPITITDPEGRVISYEYDNLNNVTKIVHPNGDETKYEYDALDRLISHIDPINNVTTYSYDDADRLLTVLVPNSANITFDYDTFGRMTEEVFYNGASQRYNYRADNLISTITTRNGVTINFDYDLAKRKIFQSVGGEDVFQYTYNIRDEALNISNNTGIVKYNYDEFGRNTFEEVNNITTTYEYNAEDEITSIKSLNLIQNQQFDSRGLLLKIEVNDNSYSYFYDSIMRLIRIEREKSNDTNYIFNNLNDPVSINHGPSIRDHKYQYDILNRISQWQIGSQQPINYSYDALSRLTDLGSQKFTYDSMGNRLNNNSIFSNSNQITENDNYIFNYDVAGNRIQKINKITSEKEIYTYNGLDQIIKYQLFPDEESVTPDIEFDYSYGPLGRRWSKKDIINQISTEFYWHDKNIIGEKNDTETRRYILEASTPIAFIENSQIYNFYRDHLGTAHEIANNQGDIVWQANYDAFGSAQINVENIENNLRFPGQYYDKENQLHYSYLRNYDPTLGTYIQSDPVGLVAGINTYSYVSSNPLNIIDPYGDCPWCLGGIIGGGIDLAIQLATNGGNFKCVDWGQVAVSTALGAVGGGIGGALQKSRNARQAYQAGLNAARSRNLTPAQAHALRRGLGAQLKTQTPQPFRSIIYRRNLAKYGDKLGPKYDPIKHSDVTKTLTDTNSLADSILKLPPRGLTPAGGAVGGLTGNLAGSGDCDCR